MCTWLSFTLPDISSGKSLSPLHIMVIYLKLSEQLMLKRLIFSSNYCFRVLTLQTSQFFHETKFNNFVLKSPENELLLIQKQLPAGNLQLQRFFNLSIKKMASLPQGSAPYFQLVWKPIQLTCRPILEFTKNPKSTPVSKFCSPLPGVSLTTPLLYMLKEFLLPKNRVINLPLE